MNTNKKVLYPLFVIQAILIIIICTITNFNLIGNLAIIGIMGLAGGKIYSSICNYKGELRRAKRSTISK